MCIGLGMAFLHCGTFVLDLCSPFGDRDCTCLQRPSFFDLTASDGSPRAIFERSDLEQFLLAVRFHYRTCTCWPFNWLLQLCDFYLHLRRVRRHCLLHSPG